MAITVYGAYGSLFVRKVLIFLKEKNLPYEIEAVIPLNVSPEYRKMHPMGKIPALRDGDFVLPDSSVICAYLEKKYPNPPLYPIEPEAYAKALWYEEYGDTALAQVIGEKIFFPKILAPMLLQKPVDEGAIEKAVKEDLVPLLSYLEGELHDKEFLVGNRFSIADIGVATGFVNLLLCGVEVDAQRWPQLHQYLARILGRPSFSQAIQKEKAIFNIP